MKKKMLGKSGLDTLQVDNLIDHSKLFGIYEMLCQRGNGPKESSDKKGQDAYRWMFMITDRLAREEEVPFETVINNSLKKGELLGDIMDAVAAEKVTRSGGKKILKNIIDMKYNSTTTVDQMIKMELDDLSKTTGRQITKF